ncbi:MAG: hypothetical protein A2077_07580 [Nitrospirae bacterium GWC2_46_6]|nr:MAG: hypothetical protein A2077_07580 [Nitrospirae bacterium GWC2_46_6]HCL81758.1 hypothetical protein [Nitrospiraceae bacterium]
MLLIGGDEYNSKIMLKKRLNSDSRTGIYARDAEAMLKKIITLEWYALLLCIISIPLFESPKSIFLVISAILFLIRHYIEKDYKSVLLAKDPRIGLLALAFVSSLSAVFALHPFLAFQGSMDFLKMYALFIIVASDFSDGKYIKTIILAIVASTTIGTGWGLANFMIGREATFELLSVGHVNHSSIYLALSLTVIIAYLEHLKTTSEKIFFYISSIILIAAFVIASSRASFLAFGAAMLMVFICMEKKKQFVSFSVMFFLITAVLIYFVDMTLLTKDYSFRDASLKTRLNLWSKGWEMFLSHPILGVGAKHFKFYNPFEYGSHAHNLLINTLAQFGIAGFSALMVFFYFILRSLKAAYKRNMLWSSACGAFIIVLMNGMFNTTLHSEHGLLFVLISAMISGNRLKVPADK